MKIERTIKVKDHAKIERESVSSESNSVMASFGRKETVRQENVYIPFHSIMYIEETSKISDDVVNDDFCPSDDIPPVEKEITITGAESKTIKQGEGIDLREGVTAKYGDDEIPFTVKPEQLDACDIGTHMVEYEASVGDKVFAVYIEITIEEIDDPTISGADEPITVEVGEEFDPLDGVTAKDGNGNDVAVEVEPLPPSEPAIIYDGTPEYQIDSVAYGGASFQINKIDLNDGDILYCAVTDKNGERFEATTTYSMQGGGAYFVIGEDNDEYPFFEVYVRVLDGDINCNYKPNRLFPAHILITKE